MAEIARQAGFQFQVHLIEREVGRLRVGMPVRIRTGCPGEIRHLGRDHAFFILGLRKWRMDKAVIYISKDCPGTAGRDQAK